MRAIGLVVLRQQPRLGVRPNVQVYALLRRQLPFLGQQQIQDLRQLLRRQLVEQDDIIQAIQEFRPEKRVHLRQRCSRSASPTKGTSKWRAPRLLVITITASLKAAVRP